ncbi:hypothetical protein N665_1537s0001 [Sinapis alba]|nr:hypothetical protein N665_1537s0001 [Sinapis alba]
MILNINLLHSLSRPLNLSPFLLPFRPFSALSPVEKNKAKNGSKKTRKLNPKTTAYTQVLGTGMDTQDTSSSVLLFFDEQRFLFNAGEGLQRFCTKHKIKLSKFRRKSREFSRIKASIEMGKTRGGGQVGSRRSRRTQGLKVVDPTPQLKVKKRTAKKMASPKKNLVLTPTRRSSGIKKVAAEDDEIEDVTPAEDDEVEDVTPAQDDEVEDVTPEDGGVVEEDKDDQAEKAMSEEDKDDAGVEGEDDEDGAVNGKENEEEAANMEDDGVLNENGNK